LSRKTTLLRWHRQGFKLFWRYKSRAASLKPRISQETVALIKQMARGNRLWGAERIWGELLKLGIRVCKRTIQKYMRGVRTTRPRGQTWRAFIHIHAQQIWACDFLPVTDLFFRSLFAFFNTLLHSRKVIHVGVTPSPTDGWTAQQLRETTAYGVGPKYLIRDNDSKFGVAFDRVAKTSGIEMLKNPITPRELMPAVNGFWAVSGVSASITCSSCMRSSTSRVLNAYVAYFNQARPQERIKQQIPEPKAESMPSSHACGKVISFPVLGGLHRDYRRSA
jgi:putative transposase